MDIGGRHFCGITRLRGKMINCYLGRVLLSLGRYGHWPLLVAIIQVDLIEFGWLTIQSWIFKLDPFKNIFCSFDYGEIMSQASDHWWPVLIVYPCAPAHHQGEGNYYLLTPKLPAMLLVVPLQLFIVVVQRWVVVQQSWGSWEIESSSRNGLGWESNRHQMATGDEMCKCDGVGIISLS